MKTMRVFILVGFALLLASCKQGQKPEPFPEELTKLERLYRIRPDSVMKHYDLSNDSLVEFPDLSRYVIASLDLSHNWLDTIIPERLPLGIEWLNLSHNRLKGRLWIEDGSIPTLRELDLSHNSLKNVSIGEDLYRIIVPYNHLKAITFSHKYIRFLDISYNSELSEWMDFDPSEIDTIVRDGVADGKPLRFKIPGIITCTAEDIFGPGVRMVDADSLREETTKED